MVEVGVDLGVPVAGCGRAQDLLGLAQVALERRLRGAVVLPRPMLHSGDLDFSFSGLKTAVLTQMKKFEAAKLEGEALERAKADLARGFVDAAVDVLVAKSLAALKKTKLKRLVVAGGVLIGALR